MRAYEFLIETNGLSIELTEYVLSDIVKLDSGNSGAYISPKGEVIELGKNFGHADALKNSSYGKYFSSKILSKYGKETLNDPYNEEVWHEIAQNDGWLKATWTVYRQKNTTVLDIVFTRTTEKAIQALIKWILPFKEEFHSFSVNGTSVSDFISFTRLLRLENN